MSKNSLIGLIANYGDSDDDSDDGLHPPGVEPEPSGRHPLPVPTGQGFAATAASGAVHPAPIPHCPWSACYDESSGFTYYWNQQTNAVTWEAPPEYLLALKLAQQQLHASGSAEVSAEEWQLYQQALAEKQNSQNKVIAKSVTKSTKKSERNSFSNKDKNSLHKFGKKRNHSEDEEKIELITSYHNSDSESNDEAETPTKPLAPPIPKTQTKPVNGSKKPKLTTKPMEYGPALPPNQNYTMPIGPELPPQLVNNVPKSPEIKIPNVLIEEKMSSKTIDEDQDENQLLMELKDKAKLLEKLGGEIPKELQKMIEEETRSGSNTPKRDPEPVKPPSNIDDLLDEIEKKELPKLAKTKNIDDPKSNTTSPRNSPRGDLTPPIEGRPLFPSIKNMDDQPPLPVMDVEPEDEKKKLEVLEKKGANLYIDSEQPIEVVSKKKLRISNSVLPSKKIEGLGYTTKYSQFIEGFSSERTGLGFSNKEVEGDDSSKCTTNTIAYGNGLMFTKGETLNEDKKDEDLDDLTDLVETKLKYLNQLQPCVVTPVQEMLIQMQTLVAAFRAGALGAAYWRRWAAGAGAALRGHEARAAPPGWSVVFLRSEGRYGYKRETDGFVQWEYPAIANTDMDISTTPPHPGIEAKEEIQPPLPPTPPPPPHVSPPRVQTPPPPAWLDPPPPGCDELPPLPPVIELKPEPKIGDELASFYSDIAELEKHTPAPTPKSPEFREPVDYREKNDRHKDKEREKEKEKEREKDKDGKIKKKSKVKISSSMGLKHKSVSNLVAKWQQVADEIHSD